MDLFWSLNDFPDENDKIRDNFKMMTFFWSSLDFWYKIAKSETVSKL